MATKTMRVPSTPKFVPAHIEGDRDFDGNGPSITTYAYLLIKNNNQLWVRVYLRARETTQDWTTAAGTAEYIIYNGGNDGVDRIRRVLSGRFSMERYLDDDHGDDPLQQGSDELVSQFVVTGDTRGDEAGIRTGLLWSLIRLKLSTIHPRFR